MMEITKRRVLSVAMALVMAMQLLGVSAVQAFAATADTLSGALGTGLVYDDVYGVRYDGYALMEKEEVGSYALSSGKEVPINQVDLVNKAGEVLASAQYASSADDEIEYQYSALEGSPLEHLAGPFVGGWEVVAVADDSGKYGVMALDGTKLTNNLYDRIEFVGGPEGRYIFAVAKSELRVDILDSNAVLKQSIDIHRYSESPSVAASATGSFYRLSGGVQCCFELFEGTFVERDDIANIWYSSLSDGKSVTFLFLSDGRLLCELPDKKLTLIDDVGSNSKLYAFATDESLCVRTYRDGNFQYQYFDFEGNLIAAPEKPDDPFAGYSRTETIVGSDNRLCRTNSGSFEICDAKGVKIVELPDPGFYSVAGAYIYSYQGEAETKVLRADGSLYKTLGKSEALSPYLDSRYYRVYETRGQTGYWTDSNLDLIEGFNGFSFMQDLGFSWVDGRILHVLRSEQPKISYAVVDDDFRQVTVGDYTIALPQRTARYLLNSLFCIPVDNQVQRLDRDMYYAVDASGKYGAISSKGEVLIPFEYENFYDAGDPGTDLILLKKDGAWEFFDTSGLGQSVSISDVSLSAVDVVYDGSTVMPTVTATYNGKALSEGIDYTIGEVQYDLAAGTGVVAVEGLGSFTGTVEVPFKVSVPDTLRFADVEPAAWYYESAA